jgi:acetolactate synthase regulatory subunit
MCHLSIAIDQSIDTAPRVFEAVERSAFYVRSIRLAPVAFSAKADVYLSLAGGSRRDLNVLLDDLHKLPAVLATHHTLPPV